MAVNMFLCVVRNVELSGDLSGCAGQLRLY